MTDPTLPPSLAAEIGDLRRRLNNLERSQRLPFSSTRGGAFLFLDDDGNTRETLGNVGLDGTVGGITAAYGEFMRGDGGAIVWMTREGERGIVYPEQPLPARRVPTPPGVTDVAVTSGSFIPLWEYKTEIPAYEVFVLRMFVTTDATSTGEIKLVCGATSTAVLAVPISTAATAQFIWLHPAPTGLYDPRVRSEVNFVTSVQARRTAGAAFNVGQPYDAKLTSVLLAPGAATNGAPVLS